MNVFGNCLCMTLMSIYHQLLVVVVVKLHRKVQRVSNKVLHTVYVLTFEVNEDQSSITGCRRG